MFAIKRLVDVNRQGVVVDYERAVVKAVREEFPMTKLKECAFHANQAVYRKIIELELSIRYINNIGTQVSCRKHLSLIYMTPETMVPLFDQLNANAKDEKLLALCDYYFHTWLDSPVWTLEEINVYLQPVQTNIDVEIWHNRLKVKSGRSNLQMYLLIDLLKQEADNEEVTLKLVSQNRLYSVIYSKGFDSVQQ